MVTTTSIEITSGQKKDLDEVKEFLTKEYNLNASYKDVISHLYRLWKQNMGNEIGPDLAQNSTTEE